MQRALAEGISHIEWYKDIDAQGDAALTPDDILVMLNEGTAELQATVTDDAANIRDLLAAFHL